MPGRKGFKTEKGKLIISLDFELFWGVHDIFDKQTYKENILGAHQVVPTLLRLFQDYQIHATWAIVGMLYFSSEQELQENLPVQKPTYNKRKLSAYDYLQKNHLRDTERRLFFAPELVEQIRVTPDQEIATHTFSHYYSLEKGQTKDQFLADIKQSIKINEQRGIDVSSIIFPRNQINQQYLDICKELGFLAYRGNESTWIYRLQRNERKHLLKRGLRLLDIYFNLFGHQTYTIQQTDPLLPVNIPSSRMLKPVSTRFRWLEGKKLTRIFNDMTYAAKRGEVYHLWWHPHNFGVNIKGNLKLVKAILRHYQHLKKLYGFKSMTMEEAASEVLQGDMEKQFANAGVMR